MTNVAATSRSLGGRLALGLGFVAMIGAVLLTGLVIVDYVYGADEPITTSQLLRELEDHVVAPLVVLLGLVGVGGYFVIRAGLGPLSRAAAEVDVAAQTAPRGVRIDHSTFPLEAQPFAAAINRLLERLDAAADAQEAFASDAAHELKTPLTILSLELERLPPEVASRLQGDVAALSRLIDQLLLLARLDAQSAAETPVETVDLNAVAADVVASMAPIALKSSRDIAFDDHNGAMFAGRQETVTAALRNLVDNALRVTPAGGTVTVISGPGAKLTVRDEGPGLTDERLAQLTHRGARADHASADGAGLGLAIVAKIMAAHGGALRTNADLRELVLDFTSD